jgi:hypothetical protein
MNRAAKGEISALFRFTQSGRLKGILLNAEGDADQVILEKALQRLLRPQQFEWLKNLFQRWA